MTRSNFGRKKTARRRLRANGKSPELHCMKVPTSGEPLLLPTSVMAEMVEYAEPRPMEGAPPWLLGFIEWETRQVPVFSFTALINGKEVGAIDSRTRIMILKSLAEAGRVPYFGILLRGIPQQITIQPEDLEETGDDKKSLGVFSRVKFDETDAIIPDMDRVTHLVTHAAFGALPITRLDD